MYSKCIQHEEHIILKADLETKQSQQKSNLPFGATINMDLITKKKKQGAVNKTVIYYTKSRFHERNIF